MSRSELFFRKGALSLAVLIALCSGAARAQGTITCPSKVPVNEELRTLPELQAKDGKLETTFAVELRDQCVPTSPDKGKTWSYKAETLRTYVYEDPATKEKRWGFPGPTLRIHKQEETAPGKTVGGDRLTIHLYNHLSPDTTPHGKCDNACEGSGTTIEECVKLQQEGKLPTAQACFNNPPPGVLPNCCCLVNFNQAYPECFHGDNTTNLHFHGTHVSPQSPQDFVLLELRPALPAGAKPPAGDHPMHPRGTVAYGNFKYDVDPPPPTQAEGTHWYHPHKHGSVSLQVANGMPGALIIEGKFDDWLRGYYGGKLAEKILVLQQVQANTNLYISEAAPFYTVNGQAQPKVTMKPGEVQRWRFVNATMQVAAQVSLNFPDGVQVKQIAMDGVRFSPENYASQPLFSPRDPSAFTISPGNRVDFLIQAPTTPGHYRVTQRLAGLSAVAERKQELIRKRDQALLQLEAQHLGSLKAVGESSEAGIVTLVVEAPAEKQETAAATGFPPVSQWPPMPPYLQNLPDTGIDQNLTFEMTGLGGGDPTTQFKINGVQYNPDCANINTVLGETETWFVQNSSGLAHPYHIHINPFQLVEQGTVVNGQRVPFVKYGSPVWQDTVALPVAGSTWDVNAGPIWNDDDAKAKCPGVCSSKNGGTWSGNWTTTIPDKMSVCGCTYTGNGYVLFRHRYLEFTGEYVLHCHFLGHEDRGMMFNVQTVCKDDPTKIGKSKPYPQPECVPGNLIPAAPSCPPAAAAAGTASGGHQGHSIH